MASAIMWYDSDIKKRMLLAVRYAENILNPSNNMLPYFAYTRDGQTGEGFGHGSPNSLPHAVGRAMDLFLNYEKYSKDKITPEAEAIYTENFFNCLDNETGMCNAVQEDGSIKAELHNLRETIEALTLLIELKKDKRAAIYADKVLKALDIITDRKTGCFYIKQAERIGWKDKFNGSIYNTQPQSPGRLTGPLTQYYKLTGDYRALDLAHSYATGTLDCFSDNGAMICDKAGTHIHSTTSSLSGAAEYAVTTGNSSFLNKLGLIYKHPDGLPMVMSSYGWIKEQINVPGQRQGEVNQIGDIVQFQLHMAKTGDADFWYGEAERFVRSALLPSQVLDSSFIKECGSPKADDRRNIKFRIIGGYGFPMPSAHLENEYSPINTLDITQGANQALCRVTEHIITPLDGGFSLNLLFSHDCEYAYVSSGLPKDGFVEVVLKVNGKVRVRIPDNIAINTIIVLRDGSAAAFSINDGYVYIKDVLRGEVVAISFIPSLSEYDEKIINTLYRIKKYGEQVISVTPSDGIYPLYSDVDFK